MPHCALTAVLLVHFSGIMGPTYRNLWVLMGAYRHLWPLMAAYDYIIGLAIGCASGCEVTHPAFASFAATQDVEHPEWHFANFLTIKAVIVQGHGTLFFFFLDSAKSCPCDLCSWGPHLLRMSLMFIQGSATTQLGILPTLWPSTFDAYGAYGRLWALMGSHGCLYTLFVKGCVANS